MEKDSPRNHFVSFYGVDKNNFLLLEIEPFLPENVLDATRDLERRRMLIAANL